MAITSYKAVVGYYNGAGTPNITTAVTGQLSDGWIPIGSPILTDAYGQCTQMMAKTDTVPVIATSAYTVVTAANPQPPDATWDAQGEPLWIDTATYLQAYTKGGSYLQTTVNLASGQVTGVLPVAKGGTAAATTLAAAANLQVFSISNNLSEIVNRTAAWLNVRPTGPLPLAGDPVSDYDAATKRWVQNLINTGTTGPTMNGVMNYGVGDFHLRDSRAYIQPYEVVSDGQLLNRADWPELWAYAQMLSPITDSEWLATPSKRGRYSLGDGATTFRVPDRNGVQDGSITELFGRGDGGISSAAGDVFENGAPDIVGNFNVYTYHPGDPSGAFTSSWLSNGVDNVTTSYGTSYTKMSFSANKSNPAYGRSAKVQPDNFVGVWVIRASGGFVAANTSWSVLNGDATLPGSGVTVVGGLVRSEYKLNNINYATSELSVQKTVGSDVSNTKLTSTSYDISGIELQKADYYFGSDGLITAHRAQTLGGYSVVGAIYPRMEWLPSNAHPNAAGGRSIIEMSIGSSSTDVSNIVFARLRENGSGTGRIDVAVPKTSGTLALQGTSGIDYKKDVVDADADEALGRILGQRLVNFVYNDDEQERVRFGVIAEEAEVIAPQYIKHNQESYEDILDEDGNKIGEKTRDRPSVDVNPIVMDLMGCVQALTKKIEAMEAEIADLKSGK